MNCSLGTRVVHRKYHFTLRCNSQAFTLQSCGINELATSLVIRIKHVTLPQSVTMECQVL